MRRFIFTLFFAFAASLFAQSSSSRSDYLEGNLRCSLVGDCTNASAELQDAHRRKDFCKEHAARLNLLIINDYFVISQQENNKLIPDTIVTQIYSANAVPKIFSADTIHQDPVWTRVYGVKQATPDSVLSLLKEKFQQNKGKVDRDELLVSYPLQDKSIFTYKKFFSALKNIGYTKIRLVGFNKEFDANVYKILQLKKFSEKQIESWESSKNECNKDWLRIVEDKLTFGKRVTFHTPWDGEPIPGPGERSSKGIKDFLDKETPKLSPIYKKFKKKLATLKDAKTPEHPDAETQIKIIVKFTIEPEGNISKIEVLSSNSQNEEFDKLICDKIAQWTFEKADSSTKVTYPITFGKK